jgi:hypothetical protein
MKRIKRLSVLGITISMLMLLACGPTVRTQKTAPVDLSQFETFAYLPNTNAEVEGKSYNDEKVNAAIVAAVNSQMREAGYSLDRDQPDLLVLISVDTDIETEVTQDPVYATYPYTTRTVSVGSYYNSYYYRNYTSFNRVVGYDQNVNRYEEGTVIIDLIDRKTKNIVWTGISTDAIYNQSTTAKAQEMAEAIFKEYPLN